MDVINTLSLRDIDCRNKKVLLRADFNVPLNAQGEIEDDLRIQAVLPTIQFILDQQASLVIISHLGRPKGCVDENLRLSICAKRLGALLPNRVITAPDCIGEQALSLKKSVEPGQILVLENLRFHKEETDQDRGCFFAQQLAQGCDLYVNDAFGCCHRRHASITDVPKEFEGRAVMGFLLENELKYFQSHVLVPRRPLAALVGGAKISTKIGILKSLVEKVDLLLIGGAMAHTFLKAMGFCIGSSKYEEIYLPLALEIVEKCRQYSVCLVLPKDLLFVDDIKDESSRRWVVLSKDTPIQGISVDIGPQTVEVFKKKLEKMKTIFWNGPMGIVEIEAFSKGTYEMAQVLADQEATTILGGGDSAAAVAKMGLTPLFDHVSTGGGAALELIEKGHLVGVDCLTKNQEK